MRMLSRSLALIGLMACVPAGAGVNSWTVRGPSGGNTTAIAFHPTQPNIVLAQTWGGLYRSTDGGATWSMPVRNNVTAVGSIVFDPTQPDSVFLGSDFVYGSTDAGITFNKLTTPTTAYVNDMAVASDGTLYLADQSAHVFRSDNHGAQWTEITGSWSSSQYASVPDLIADPNQPNRIYAAVGGLGLFRSEDRGATWNAPTVSPPLNPYIYSVAVQPGNSNRLMIATDTGFYVSADRGGTWSLKGGGALQTYTYAAFDPASPSNAVVVGKNGSVRRSTDSGVTWPASSTELKVQFVSGGAFTPGTAGRLLLGTTEGPMLSTDGGVTFAPQFSGIHASVVKGFASARDGALYSLYEYGPAGAYRRDGDTWSPLNNANLNSLISTQASDIATAPSDSSLIYVITRDNQLVRSADGGMSWSSPATEFSTSSAYPNHAVADPSDANVAYVSTDFGGLWKTTNRGATWSRIGVALPNRVNTVGVNPNDTRILYVVCSDNNGALLGIFRSRDGGQSWESTGALRPGQILGFTFHPTDVNTVYAYSGTDVLKTSDGGDHWAQVDFGAPSGVYVPALSVLIDPVIPSTMFVVSSPNISGFLRSVDSGATWETFRFSAPQGDFLFLTTAALDPLQPSLLHASVYGLGIAEYEVAPDLGVTVQGLESSMPVLGSRAVRVQVRNLSLFAASASEVQITLPSFLTTTAPTGCSLVDSVIQCKLPALRGQASQAIDFSVTASSTPSTGNVRAEVKGHEPDPDATSNAAVITATTVAGVSSKPGGGGGGGGGGGAFDWLIIACLGLLMRNRNWLTHLEL